MLTQKIFLIGMMGCGKSYWSKQLADTLGYTVVDTDAEIEKNCRLAIPQIFSQYGERFFRTCERDVLVGISHSSKSVIVSTGGGMPCFNQNMDLMNANGKTIWLNTPVATIAERLMQNNNGRPMVQNLNEQELLAFLTEKLEERKPYYSQAQIELNTLTLTTEQLVNAIQ